MDVDLKGEARSKWKTPDDMTDFEVSIKEALKLKTGLPQETVKELEDMVNREPKPQDTQAYQAELHEAMLGLSVRDMPLMPIEDLDQFKSMSTLRQKFRGIKLCGSLPVLEDLATEVHAGKAMATQLRDSVKQSIKYLRGNIAKRDREKKRDLDKMRADQEKKKKKAAETEQQKSGKDFTALMCNLAAVKSASVYDTLESYEEALYNNNIDMDKPFVVLDVGKRLLTSAST